MRNIFKLLSMSFLIGTYLTFSIAIIMASKTNWLVTLDFNSVGEGYLELVLLFVGWLFMFLWWVLPKK